MFQPSQDGHTTRYRVVRRPDVCLDHDAQNTLKRRYGAEKRTLTADDDQELFRRRIYVDEKGHRYVKVEELLRDPVIRERLESAERLAERLGLRRIEND